MNLRLTLFILQDLNWFQKPIRPFTLDFSSRKFDILFDLSIEEYFPLKYLSGLSPATYKIGIFEEPGDYDLMIGLQENKTMAFLVEQVKHYLSLIHSKNN